MIKASKLPNSLEMPVVVGNRKTKEYVFTKTKFYNKLKKLADSNEN